MAGVVPNVGEVEFLKAMLAVTAMNATMTLKLYTNNVTPGESDTAGTYTGAAGFGYADITLNGASWTVSTDGSGVTSGVYALQSWTFTGALGNVYGYFVVRADTGVLLFAERFSDGPYPISFNGDIINVTPKTYLD
jgi:hypothetical protein